MNMPDDGGPSGTRTSRTTSSMRRLLTDGTNGTGGLPNPTNTNPPPFNKSRPTLGQFVVPAILVLMLMVGVALLAFSLGVSRGRDNANAERDRFYEGRSSSWRAAATVQAANPVATADPNATPSVKSGYNLANATLARIDKIDGEKLTVLLLDAAGQPGGPTLVVNITKQTQVWRNVPNQAAELKPGDAILFVGDRNDKGDFDARNVVVLSTP